jgi:hypothetical protein
VEVLVDAGLGEAVETVDGLGQGLRGDSDRLGEAVDPAVGAAVMPAPPAPTTSTSTVTGVFVCLAHENCNRL